MDLLIKEICQMKTCRYCKQTDLHDDKTRCTNCHAWIGGTRRVLRLLVEAQVVGWCCLPLFASVRATRTYVALDQL